MATTSLDSLLATPETVEDQDKFYEFIEAAAKRVGELRSATSNILDSDHRQRAEDAIRDMEMHNSSMLRYPVFGEEEKKLVRNLHSLLTKGVIPEVEDSEQESAAA